MSECEIWTGKKDHKGFGVHRTSKLVDGKKFHLRRPLHVALWERDNGSIPEGQVVAHRCGTPSCINTEHFNLMSEDEAQTVYQSKKAFDPETHWKSKLTAESVREIRQLHQLGESQAGIAETYGVSHSTIAYIVAGKTWTHLLSDDDLERRRSVSPEAFRTSECIAYHGARDKNGYGRYSKWVNGKQVVRYAHQIAWEKEHGIIPTGMVVVQYCGFIACINPAHLRLISKTQATHLVGMSTSISRTRAKGNRHGRSKLSEEQVKEIKELLSSGERKATIARLYGVTQPAIARIEAGHTWSHVGKESEDGTLPIEEARRLRQDYLDQILGFNKTTHSAPQLTSSRLAEGQVYTRDQLMELFNLQPTYAIRNLNIVMPDKGKFQSVWLFVSGPRSEETSDGDIIYFPRHTQDKLITQHRDKGLELVVFHRTWKHEHGMHSGYRFDGTFKFLNLCAQTGQLKLQRTADPLLEQARADIEAFELEHELNSYVGNEGTQYRALSSRYERDAAARAAAIKHHGTSCQACGFSFAKMYGSHGQGYVQVHHQKSLSSYGGRVKVDPVTDMAVLCSNCHSMIHRNPQRPLSVEELRKLISDTNSLLKNVADSDSRY